jgi:hypothetical protein
MIDASRLLSTEIGTVAAIRHNAANVLSEICSGTDGFDGRTRGLTAQIIIANHSARVHVPQVAESPSNFDNPLFD